MAAGVEREAVGLDAVAENGAAGAVDDHLGPDADGVATLGLAFGDDGGGKADGGAGPHAAAGDAGLVAEPESVFVGADDGESVEAGAGVGVVVPAVAAVNGGDAAAEAGAAEPGGSGGRECRAA